MMRKIFRFFFPDDTKIKVENSTFFSFDGKTLKVWRRFYTFRSFFCHYIYALFVNPIQDVVGYYNQNPLASRCGAIAFDNSTATGASGNISIAHTSTGNSLVAVALNTVYDDGAVTVSTVKYNTVDFTTDVTNSVVNTSVLVDERYLANPAKGSNTYAVTYSSANLNSRVGGIVTLSGANTSSPKDASTTNNGAAGTNETVTLTTNFANSMLCEVGMEVSTTLPTQGGSETQRWAVNQGGAGDNSSVGTTRTTTSAGGYTNGWTKSTGAGRWGVVIVAIREAVAGTRRTLTGIGI